MTHELDPIQANQNLRVCRWEPFCIERLQIKSNWIFEIYLTHTHTHIHTHTHTYTHVHTRTHTHTHTHKHSHAHTNTHTHKHTYTHRNKHRYTQTYTHKHAHTRTQTDTHTHIHISLCGSLSNFIRKKIMAPESILRKQKKSNDFPLWLFFTLGILPITPRVFREYSPG